MPPSELLQVSGAETRELIDTRDVKEQVISSKRRYRLVITANYQDKPQSVVSPTYHGDLQGRLFAGLSHHDMIDGVMFFGLELKNPVFFDTKKPYDSLYENIHMKQVHMKVIQGASAYSITKRAKSQNIHNLADVVYYLLSGGPGKDPQYTDEFYATGNRPMATKFCLDGEQLQLTGQYLDANGIRTDGGIYEQVDALEWVNQMAPLFMCHAQQVHGKIALYPALPFDPATKQVTDSLDNFPIERVFTKADILPGTFARRVVETHDPRNTEVRYHEQSVADRGGGKTESVICYHGGHYDWGTETFDMSEVCADRATAEKCAMYLCGANYVEGAQDEIVFTVPITDEPVIMPGRYVQVDAFTPPAKSGFDGYSRAGAYKIETVTTSPSKGTVTYECRGDMHIIGQYQVTAHRDAWAWKQGRLAPGQSTPIGRYTYYDSEPQRVY